MNRVLFISKNSIEMMLRDNFMSWKSLQFSEKDEMKSVKTSIKYPMLFFDHLVCVIDNFTSVFI